jgi:hypothetical protein
MTNSEPSNNIIFDTITEDSRSEHERQLQLAIQHMEALPKGATAIDKARINLDMAEANIGLGKTNQAWELARHAFDAFVTDESWQDAVEACEVMYNTQEPANIIALAHGIWISITYPISAQTTITMLNYVVEESPDNSDGAAVAARTAHYIADLRASEDEHEELSFIAKNLLFGVAQRHGKVSSQQELDLWMERLNLTDPADFLPKMGRILDIIVVDQWWIDRDDLRSRLPVN